MSTTMNILTLLFGAGLACFGMLAGALADRIRYGRAQRARAARAPRGEVQLATPGQAQDADDSNATATDRDARSALVGLGYKKWIATEAVREARAKLGPKAELVDLIQKALSMCPKVMSAEAS